MKVLLHGDNQVASRQKLEQIIKSHRQEKIHLDGQKINETDLRQALESHSFFGDEKVVIIENLASRPLVNLLVAEPNTPIIVWQPKQIAVSAYKSFQIELFKTPATIFKFLDSMRPPLPNEAAELVLYMLGRRVSDLIIASDKPELLKQAPWQKSQLIAQAKKHSLSKLMSLHTQLLELEYSHKTGNNILPLASELDLMLANL